MNSDPVLIGSYQSTSTNSENDDFDFDVEYEDVSKCIYDVLMNQLDFYGGIEKDSKATINLRNCALCDFKCSPDKINSHYFVHLLDTFEDFECPDCALIFEKLDDFIDHVNLHDQEKSANKKEENCENLNELVNASNSDLNETIFQSPIIENFIENPHQILVSEVQRQIEDLDLEINPPFDLALLDDVTSKQNEFETVINIESPPQSHHQDSTSNSDDSESYSDGAFNCAQCSAQFKKKELLLDHLKIHLKFECKYCQKFFILETSLAQHMKKHEGTNLNYCQVCNVPYAVKHDLKVHFKKNHANLMEYKCVEDNCGKSFRTSNDLKSHQKIHSNKRLLKCKNCPKTFNHITSLRNHMSVHTGEKKFQCNYCAKFFSLLGNLKVHIKSVHTNERSFECSVCGKTFARTSNLAEHLNIHKGLRPYKCTEIVNGVPCNKAFSNSSTLGKHRKIHLNVRAFKCLICSKTFVQLAHLKKHQRTHTQEKSYLCSICNKSFQRSDTLKKHIQTIHERKNSINANDKPIVISNQLIIPTTVVQTHEYYNEQQSNTEAITLTYQLPAMWDNSAEISDLLMIENQIDSQL